MTTEQARALTDLELRRALAEAMGWRFEEIRRGVRVTNPDGLTYKYGGVLAVVLGYAVPRWEDRCNPLASSALCGYLTEHGWPVDVIGPDPEGMTARQESYLNISRLSERYRAFVGPHCAENECRERAIAEAALLALTAERSEDDT